MGREMRWVSLIVALYLVIALFRLGNITAPQTDWLANEAGQSFTIQFEQVQTVARLNIYGGAGMGKYKLETSLDGKTWALLQEVNHDHVFAFNWNTIVPAEQTLASELRLTVTEPGARIIELGAFDAAKKPIVFRTIEPLSAGTVIDEQSLVPWARTAMNSTYFDEIYHARTAYEFIHHLDPYENTHPPLGKAIQSLGIMAFGMTPFGWRIMGTLAGGLMLFVLYGLVKLLTRETRWALIATALFSLDFMHFTQTRMGTVDVYLVLFVMLTFYYMFHYAIHRRVWALPLAGVFFGMASAVKWNGLYAGIGLAVIYGYAWWADRQQPGLWKRTLVRVGYGILFFILIPAAIYVASYVPFVAATPVHEGWAQLWQYQKDMYDYHSQLKATHPFSSKWYEWPFIHRPLWLYGAPDLPTNVVSTLVVMGNPLLWWAGTVAVFWYLMNGWRRRETSFVLIALLALYLPWIVSPRDLTFIYHFFPMVPFWLIALVFGLRQIESGYPRLGKWVTWATLIGAGLLFIVFYPALSGVPVARSFAESYWKWFDSWQFF
jgi:dolichyl-phosphate-mannose--protein O-mannosyl transferase